MPKFKIEQSSHLPAGESYAKVRDYLENDESLKKYDPQMKLSFDTTKMSASAKGSQFSAHLAVKENNSGSYVIIEVELPFLLTPFKGVIQDSLAKGMKKILV